MSWVQIRHVLLSFTERNEVMAFSQNLTVRLAKLRLKSRTADDQETGIKLRMERLHRERAALERKIEELKAMAKGYEAAERAVRDLIPK